MNKTFTFIVFTFNHEKYILEYLESVKFQIESYGSDYKIKLVVADDSSTDNTKLYIDNWCKLNNHIFDDILIINNQINIGTCKNFTNTWDKIDSDLFHFCGGDDLYSYENIFELSNQVNYFDVVSCLPLYLTDDKLWCNYKAIYGVLISNVIYSNFKQRIRGLNFIFAPCLFYTSKLLSNSSIREFVNLFKVVEDFPLQVKMSEEFNPVRFNQSNKILLYYRRTNNSTYLIKNTVFSEDKISVFNYLIKTEERYFHRLLLINRRFCFKLKSNILRVSLNLNYLVFGLRCIAHSVVIINRLIGFNVNLNKHKVHYITIKLNASSYSILP